MKRLNTITGEMTSNKKIDNFINDILRVYKKHDMAISHETPEKALKIVGLDKGFVKYLERALDAIPETIAKNPKMKYKFYKPKENKNSDET